MISALENAIEKGIDCAIVSGSDYKKIIDQVGPDIINKCLYCFSENGLLTIKNGQEYEKQSLKDYLGEENLQRLINFSLRYIADLDIPIKRGTFIEYRNGLVNISPIGRNCSPEERAEFENYDKSANIRKDFVKALSEEFLDLDLQYSIGGQISFDVFPKGWDKTYCLKFIENEYDEIHFFGDKCTEGGNDFEIFEDSRTIGHQVTAPQDTIIQLNQIC